MESKPHGRWLIAAGSHILHDAMEAHDLRSSCFDVTAWDAEARLTIPLTRAPSLDSDHLHQKIWPAYVLRVLDRSSPRPLTASCEHRWSVRFLVTFCPLSWIKMVLKHMKCLSEVKHFFWKQMPPLCFFQGSAPTKARTMLVWNTLFIVGVHVPCLKFYMWTFA